MLKTLTEVSNTFDYEQYLQAQLHGKPQSINAYDECCGRYADTNKVALIWEVLNGYAISYTFKELDLLSAKLANHFKSIGIKPGQCVAGLLSRTPELLITILATWRIGAIYQPMFTAFESKAIAHRINTAQTQLIVTNLNQRTKLNNLHIKHIITVNASSEGYTNDADFWTVLNQQSDIFEPVSQTFEDNFLMMFTSGTTGLPKSVPVPLKAIAAFKSYMLYAVDLRNDDSFWNLADPGWAYGLYYGITGPLSLGNTIILNEKNFTVDNAIETIKKYKVTNLAGSPTAFRLLFGFKEQIDLNIKSHLRVVSSAGEPLTPEVINWFKNDLDVNIYDQYGQTELGMVIGNHHALSHHVKIGSAGFAIPGHRFAVLDEQYQEVGIGQSGVLAIDTEHSPLFWFKGYDGHNRKSFVGKYYITGDTVSINAFGGIDFIGRNDDVITTSGYRVGPFDIESTLLECDEVLESAVIGKPDPTRTEIIKAFVVLKPHITANDELKDKLQEYVRNRLSKHAYPREIEFIQELPKTPSGKIQRNVLKNEEIQKMQELSYCS
ncbi:acyl-CoA synthetase [Acinetobacter puyangensis]|uniref:Acetyl-CoA synthetase n=1 Tax=Acinetobacter puyangensis TaxID=1096779 RepID=A0A240ECW8_9GAMM|nr:AMP-binding protein [Acinetobacter puyangensis]SNX45750.1 acetyl-CoA synthetase [Acinetobacter puyangensis]